MTFKCRFNATCFLFKINRFVLIFSKTSNRFVLKICSGGFADYKSGNSFLLVRKKYFASQDATYTRATKQTDTQFKEYKTKKLKH